jgi:excisionase family DNA binding protein
MRLQNEARTLQVSKLTSKFTYMQTTKAETIGLAIWYTREQAAEILNVSLRQVDQWTASGELPVKRKGRRLVRILRTDLEAFAAAA